MLDAEEARRLLRAERDHALQRREAAQAVLADELESTEVNPVTQHPGDNAAHVIDREVAQTSLEQAEADLAEVDAALARVADDSYGRCEVDGEPIDPERLRARPTARYCTVHQQQMEAQA
ncbi:MAG: TraR/DksA family transcriptional regulator [Actinobacteria bacterium QS_8_72_14]|nr:MAG: TraR/DksA family transcriptional regulator [Actinobacteria bacterium QS_8_72_14]